MPKYTFEEIKRLLSDCVYEHKCEAELWLTFADKPYQYMIIIYGSHCSFQRCGKKAEQSGEYDYASLDELYKARQIDDIIPYKHGTQHLTRILNHLSEDQRVLVPGLRQGSDPHPVHRSKCRLRRRKESG